MFAASLKLDSLTRSYAGIVAVDHLNLSVAAGEIVCLLGPSGCGKTTLLRLISGIERPTSGSVFINGEEVAGAKSFVPPEKRGVGLMFQDFALFPHMTVLDNVAYGLKSLKAEERKQAAQAILDRVGLGSFAAAYPSTLSGGQQQRVALARAIVPRPAVMLMDEPFSGLDVQLRDEMQEETLALLRETRATALIVTHNPEEAMRIADRIAVLDKGRVIQIGTAEELYRAPASLFVARLFSEINEIPATAKGGRIETKAGALPASNIADGPAVLAIRERAISLSQGDRPSQAALPGRVLASRFLGDIVRLDVALDGFERPLKVRLSTGQALPRGADVWVTIDPEAVLAFAAETIKADAT